MYVGHIEITKLFTNANQVPDPHVAPIIYLGNFLQNPMKLEKKFGAEGSVFGTPFKSTMKVNCSKRSLIYKTKNKRFCMCVYHTLRRLAVRGMTFRLPCRLNSNNCGGGGEVSSKGAH